MAELRTKLLTLAGIASMFAGMAHAQLTGCQAASNAVFVAAEGAVEQTSDITITCPAIAGAATLNLSVYLSPAVSITSAVLGSGNSAKSETLAGFGALGGGLAGQQNGTVSGSSVTFSGLVTTPTVATTITITNIKINASQIATSSGAPTAVTATIFVGGTNVTPAVLSAVNVAFAANGLASIKSSQVSGNSIASIPICSGVNAYIGLSAANQITIAGTNYQNIEVDGPWSGTNANINVGAGSNVQYIFGNPSFNVQFSEGFATAFKTQGSATVAQQAGADPGSGAAANTTLGSEFTNNTYTGFGFSANNTTNQATSGTRIQVVLNNIPGNVTVYVPLQLNANGGQMILVNSATGAYAATTGSTANGSPGATAGNNGGNSSAGALTVSNGSATAVYEETVNAPGAVESYVVPVFLAAGGAAVSAPSTAITATVSFAPIGSSSSVPNFVSGSSTATVNGAAFSACSTTLLFPFVTNQLGFDTGLAISNTSSDLLASGGTKSTAAAQSGTCVLNFFGNTAPAAVTTASVTTGTTYAAAASTVAPGFQGYMIANCNFLYGHGFAYVVYNLTQNNGAAMGYLADVIQADRKSSGSTDSTVGSNVPEN